MKNYLATLISALVLQGSVYGQSTEQMRQVYSASEIQEIKDQNAYKLEIWEKYSTKGFEVIHSDLSNDKFKEVDYVLLSDKTTQMSIEDFVAIIESGAINPMRFYWRPATSKQLFHLKDTNIYIVIPAISQL